MCHTSGACHWNVADGAQAMVFSVTGTLTDSVVPYKTARSIVAVENIVDIKTDDNLFESKRFCNIRCIVEAEIALGVAWQ